MAILGTLIKSAIDLKDSLTSDSDPVQEQATILQQLLETAKDTSFGLYYGFSAMLDEKDIHSAFAKAVPYHDYNQINDMWWKRIKEGLVNITWPGKPHYFALSSGTTGKKSKRIPVTKEMLAAIRSTSLAQVAALANYELPADFFDKEVMALGSSTDLQAHDEFLEGEISGITASTIPFWFKGFYKPGEDIAKIDNWDERVATIAKRAKSWDIAALSGIPSWIELMLKEVIAYHNAHHIHEVWPNLQVFTSGGVAFQPYEKSFRQLLGREITVIDTYLASEGFMGYQSRPDTTAMKLSTNAGIYFEFVPFKPDYIHDDGSLAQDAPALTLSQVEKDVDYVLIISTVSGAWRYLIGDTIAFTDVTRAEIKITGRTKFFLNVVGSQLSVNKMEDALRALEKKFDIEIPEFTLSAKKIDGKFYHCWYLGTTASTATDQLAEALDASLKAANKNYAVARGKSLKGVKVTTIPPSIFYEWNATSKKKGGQVKMEKVMDEEKFIAFEGFIAKQ